MPPVAEAPPPASPPADFVITRKRTRLFGLTLDEVIKVFFGGNAIVSVIVLALITIFLFREGSEFFGQNRRNLEIYRHAGLEFVDLLRAKETDHTSLSRYLSDLRLRQFKQAVASGEAPAAANAALAEYDRFASSFSDAVDPLRALVSDLADQASALKTTFLVNEDRKVERLQLLKEGRADDAAKVVITTVDTEANLQPLLAARSLAAQTFQEVIAATRAALTTAPTLADPELQSRLTRFQELANQHLAEFPAVESSVRAWDWKTPVPWYQSITAFVFGRQWLTASFWQDWYGILPLLVGSLMVSAVALLLAIPLGVGAAVYVNQIARPWEQKFIKPSIEFISAIPSVVLGFFGIAVLGQALRALSQVSWLSWLPGFPYSERLNILTAGCLLALIAIPTIFTLAEDALNNVPRALRDASLALGATRLQTIAKIIAPAALSGIVSAILLGFGRVIGETMVVLLCAGNRIAIPDFSAGLGVVTQPVHTMTGIIAQEMGEVVRGSIHYRALFCVGIVLFFFALLVNFLAQKIVRRYRIVST